MRIGACLKSYILRLTYFVLSLKKYLKSIAESCHHSAFITNLEDLPMKWGHDWQRSWSRATTLLLQLKIKYSLRVVERLLES